MACMASPEIRETVQIPATEVSGPSFPQYHLVGKFHTPNVWSISSHISSESCLVLRRDFFLFLLVPIFRFSSRIAHCTCSKWHLPAPTPTTQSLYRVINQKIMTDEILSESSCRLRHHYYGVQQITYSYDPAAGTAIALHPLSILICFSSRSFHRSCTPGFFSFYPLQSNKLSP